MTKTITSNESTGFTIWLVCNLWQREMRKALKPFGLTHAQYILLETALRMGETQKNITQIALANATGTDKMMASKVLRTLESKKLLKRNDLKSDSRAKQIGITKKGADLVEKAGKAVAAFETSFFSPLGKNDKSVHKALIKLLK